MNRALPLVLLLALILAAGAWLLQDPPGPSTDPLTGPGLEDEAPSTTERSGPELGADPTEPEAVAVTSERSSVPQEQPDEAEVQPWPAEGIDLTLVHAATGAPAAGALVHLLPGDESEVRSMTNELLSHRDDLTPDRLTGKLPFRADEAGRVRVPEPSQFALVRVSLGALRGYELFGGFFEPDLRVELAEPVQLVVAVEDSLGNAQGKVDVACDGPWSQLAWGELTTNLAGQVGVRNVNTLLATCYGSRPPLLELTTTTWDRRRITETVDLRAVPAAPVLLVVPAGGEVQVRIVDPDGEGLTDDSRQVALEVVAGPATRVLEDWVWGDNTASFRGLPPGAAVHARLGEYSDSKLIAGSDGVVPAAGDEPLLLLVTVEPAPDRSVTGRLVDAQGDPIVDATYTFRSELRIGGGTSSSSRGGRRTDADGRFSEEIGSHMNGIGSDESTLTLSFTVDREEGPGWTSEQLAFTSELVFPVDLGDVPCAAPPLLVAGRLVDLDGDPIEGGWVRASWLPPEDDEPGTGRSHPRHIDGQASRSSDADGAFAVHADTTEQRLYLSAGAEGYSDSPHVPFRAGATGLVVALGSAGSLLGSVDFPDGTDPSSWSAGIQPAEESERDSFSPDTITGGWSSDSVWWDSDLDRGANFGWTDLKPGLYNVRIKLRGMAEPVHQWDDLVVGPGEVNRDPRLQDIELDGMVTGVPIEVVDASGGAVLAARVQLIGGTDWNPWTELPGGQGSITLVELPAEVRVQAEGYLTRSVAVDGSPLRVVVEPAPTIELVLPPGLQLPEDAQLLAQLAFRAEDEGPWGLSGTDQAAFRDGRARTSAAALGEVRVSVLLKRSSGFGSSTSWLTWPDETPVFEVTAGSDGAVFDLPVTQAMIDADG